MSDILADRFLAIADLADDGDWRDVRRRARVDRRRWRVALLAAAVAVVVTAVAVAASGGWVFKRAAYSEPSFSRSFGFQGATWTLTGYLTGNGEISCFRLAPKGSGRSGPVTCPVRLQTPPGLIAPRETTLGYDHGAGQIWFGDTPAPVARVVITDERGRAHAAPATMTPTLSHPTVRFRLWLIALPGSTARTITAYDGHGRILYRESPSRQSEPTPTDIH